jgi:hypothetical protein
MWIYLPNIPSMPSTCVVGMRGSNSDSNSQDWTFEPYVTSKGTATRRASSWRGWKNRPWIKHLSGLTLKLSTAQHGIEKWISSLPDSHANHSVQQETKTELTTPAGSGRKSTESYAKWDPNTSSWKTLDKSSTTDSPTSSVTLPRSGSMRNGECSAQPKLARHTNETDSGYSPPQQPTWATPSAMDSVTSGNSKTTKATKKYNGTLTDQTIRDPNSHKLWGTPVALDDQKTPEAHMATKTRLIGPGRTEPTSLTVQSKMPENWKDWPTPVASEAYKGTDPQRGPAGGSKGLKDAAIHSEHGPQPETTTKDGKNGSVKADLNPRFVEALMGVPQGWLTNSTSEETASSQEWQQKHSPNWRLDLEKDK